ncbi:MAG: acyl-CoA dehydrogenase family protein [Microbacterium sp.]|uniref:acyl-CoA dehydrogenase family protein n=1 Tax=Microbacterium sp. TaxID=51671 RepID=UPI0039E34890
MTASVPLSPLAAQHIADPVERARGTLPVLRAHAPAAEHNGRLTAPILNALTSAKLLQLGAAGARDAAADCAAIVDAVSALAEADASTAWVVGSFAYATAQAAAAPEVHGRVLGSGKGSIVTFSPSPTREVRRVPGGFRVSGRWNAVPGSAHADWLGVLLVLPDDEEGRGVARTHLAMTELTRHRTWTATGLRAASADTVEADEVFVADEEVQCGVENRGHDPALAIAPAAAVVGAAAGALEGAIVAARTRPWAGTRYRTAAESATIQGKLSDAAMHLSSARLRLARAASTLDGSARSGRPMTSAVRTRCRIDTGWATADGVAAVEAVMGAIGAEAVAESAPFERCWRDVQTLSRHGAVDPLTAREAYGRFLVSHEAPLAELPL